ncbi:CatA-like O-acetyltransferase [Psychroserpens sp. NJDZ02]|uniref:CatA-like O-acetyltransferase n=1 Tax=Psychroserpens sp. NJDZ02 TaxID=2570561 RepID=UPI0010A93EC1|nr:CatA-like O-acetyltransferase [Psychroserpens sp. NJDZ02]QCE43210.1 chloramphenicol acetyltransferase [Psychroserpens sp. NJDZ02]
MKTLDINTWDRKELFQHFLKLKDPYFGVTIPFNVDKAYQYAKDKNVSFFGVYLHDCMKAINAIDNLKYRIEDNTVQIYDTIHASATIMRPNNTFGFSFIDYDEELNIFLSNLSAEKRRIEGTPNLFPPVNGLNCIHCSALPWLNFSGHKEPVSGVMESIPKLAFGKVVKEENKLIMNVAINVNHALVDGYHVGLFSEMFQKNLNK